MFVTRIVCILHKVSCESSTAVIKVRALLHSKGQYVMTGLNATSYSQFWQLLLVFVLIRGTKLNPLLHFSEQVIDRGSRCGQF